ncbi:MAG: reverse transcriptase domain-containing protein, partial [Gaiellaceae bacterium]
MGSEPLITTRSGRVSRPVQRLSPDAKKKRYDNETYFSAHCSLAEAFASMEELLTDPVSQLADAIHPMAYASKPRSEDTPLYHEAMRGQYKEDFLQAMQNEIDELTKQKTWDIVPRPSDHTVLPGTWAYKVKRYPDGRVRKFKARFCVRGDKQVDCVNCFDTYAPVVSWSTVRLMMTMSMVLGLKSKQVDYNNAFAQARLKKPVYVEIPRDFQS